ncbi:hypothetical protein [Streptomyces platensis]
MPGGVGGTAWIAGTRYLALYTTALQIRFAAVFAFFVLGALLLARRLPPVRGRTTAALLTFWAWGLVAGTLAVTVSAPWLIAAGGHGSFRFLPQLASQLLRMATDGTGLRWGLFHLSAGLGGGVPAALTCGLVAGVAAAVTLRVTGGRAKPADATAAAPTPEPGQDAAKA